MSAIGAQGILFVQNDVLAEAEDEFNAWYQEEHVLDRLAVPGFKSARRYQALDRPHAYMAVYECASLGVLTSPAYRERLAHPTPRTRAIMPSFRNMLRSACSESWSTGVGLGGGAIVVLCKTEVGMEAAARAHIHAGLMRERKRSAALTRMALWESDASATGGTSPEMDLRGSMDRCADWVLFLESCDLAQSQAALAPSLFAADPAATGLRIDAVAPYRLLCAWTSSDLAGAK